MCARARVCVHNSFDIYHRFLTSNFTLIRSKLQSIVQNIRTILLRSIEMVVRSSVLISSSFAK